MAENSPHYNTHRLPPHQITHAYRQSPLHCGSACPSSRRAEQLPAISPNVNRRNQISLSSNARPTTHCGCAPTAQEFVKRINKIGVDDTLSFFVFNFALLLPANHLSVYRLVLLSACLFCRSQRCLPVSHVHFQPPHRKFDKYDSV